MRFVCGDLAGPQSQCSSGGGGLWGPGVTSRGVWGGFLACPGSKLFWGILVLVWGLNGLHTSRSSPVNSPGACSPHALPVGCSRPDWGALGAPLTIGPAFPRPRPGGLLLCPGGTSEWTVRTLLVSCVCLSVGLLTGRPVCDSRTTSRRSREFLVVPGDLACGEHTSTRDRAFCGEIGVFNV